MRQYLSHSHSMMHKALQRFAFLPWIAAVVLAAVMSFTEHRGCTSAAELGAVDRGVLMELRSHWNLTWNTSDFCNSAQVVCSKTGTAVARLNLNGLQLRGTIPSNISKLSATLERLALSNNELTGSIPNEFRRLTKLNSFLLGMNSLSGTLADDVFLGWASLSSLKLGTNQLSGSIPGSVVNCSKLRYLELDDNRFSGSIPAMLLTSLPLLETLVLRRNNLTGSVPDLGDDGATMTTFRVDNNLLEGFIDLSGMLHRWGAALTFLDVGDNKNLWGTLPATMPDLCALKRLMLDGVSLGGSTIPPSLARCANMTTFHVRNCSLTGSLPSDFGSAWRSSLVSFRAHYNRLTGTIPREYGLWEAAVIILLNENRLSGAFDLAPMFKNSLLEQIDISWNNGLEGSLPSVLLPLNIREIHLSKNKFNGTIPELWGVATHLEQFTACSNLITGTLPSAFAGLAKLNIFMLGDNSITGTIPPSWGNGNLAALDMLVLQDNRGLRGTIPAGIVRSPFGVITICDTSICGSALALGLFTLYCADLSMTLADYFTIVERHEEYQTGDVPCLQRKSATVTASKEQPPAERWPTRLLTSPPAAQVMVASVGIGAALAPSADSADIQIFASVLQSTCMASQDAGVSNGDDDGDSALSTVTSPFASRGHVASVLGNVGLSVGAFVLQWVWVLGLRVKAHNKRQPRGRGGFSVFVAPLRLLGSSCAATIRFPSLSIVFAMFLSGGIVRSTVKCATSPSVSTAAQVITVIVAVVYFLLAAMLCVVCIYRRHVVVGATLPPFRYRTFPRTVFSPPVPIRVARWLLPRGEWQSPVNGVRSMGAIVNPYHGDLARWWAVMPLTNWVLQVLMALPLHSNASCDAVQILAVLLVGGVGVALFVWSPNRIIAVSLLGGVVYVMISCTIIVGMLFRRGQVTFSTVRVGHNDIDDV